MGCTLSGYGAGALGDFHDDSLPCVSVVQGEVSPGKHCHRRQSHQQTGVGEQHHECAWILPLAQTFRRLFFSAYPVSASEMVVNPEMTDLCCLRLPSSHAASVRI